MLYLLDQSINIALLINANWNCQQVMAARIASLKMEAQHCHKLDECSLEERVIDNPARGRDGLISWISMVTNNISVSKEGCSIFHRKGRVRPLPLTSNYLLTTEALTQDLILLG